MDGRSVSRLLRRVRMLNRGLRITEPPFPPERLMARCAVDGIRRVEAEKGATWSLVQEAGRRLVLIDQKIPPRTPQWNGSIALALAHTLLPPEERGAARARLAEVSAAEILLPARVFRPIAARTDLTMDGLRDLVFRFSAPARLTVLQGLWAGSWAGFALLWRQEAETLRLRWCAASPGLPFPRSVVLGASAAAVWSSEQRLYQTLRTGRPHHGVERVWTGGRSAPRWWFTRFGVVHDEGARSVLALVILDRRHTLREH